VSITPGDAADTVASLALVMLTSGKVLTVIPMSKKIAMTAFGLGGLCHQ